jgi:translation elongation factor EF-Ts
VNDWRKHYESIELTPEEVEEAIFEGRVKKFFKERADLKEQEVLDV